MSSKYNRNLTLAREALLKDLQSASDEGRKIIYNELYLDYEHSDPYRRGI